MWLTANIQIPFFITTSDDSNLLNILTQHPYWILFHKFDQINNGPFIYFYWIAYSNISSHFLACHTFCWKCINLSIYFRIFSKLVLLCTTAAAGEPVTNYSLIKVTFILVSKIISKMYTELWFPILCVYMCETWFIIVKEERFMVLAQKVKN